MTMVKRRAGSHRSSCPSFHNDTTDSSIRHKLLVSAVAVDEERKTEKQDDPRIIATYNWFRTIVIGEKLCPFAPPFQRQSELMRVVSASSPTTNRRQAMELIRQESHDLVGSETIPSSVPATSSTTNEESSRFLTSLVEEQDPRRRHETTLVILDHPEWSTDFREFVRFSWDVQEQVIEDGTLTGILQLVLFHPLATHQTYSSSSSTTSAEHGMDDNSNAGDYTIRSPYPTIHLLREIDVLRAVQGGYPNLETLPARNQAKMIQQGVDICRARLSACYHVVQDEEKP